MTSPLVYVAGPLFDEGERWWIESLDLRISEAGYTTFLPHRDNPSKTSDNVGEIFATNTSAIERAGVVVASLNGLTTDDGTAWELGFAYARGKHLIGLHTDWRRRFDDEVVNLMIEWSLDALVHSLDDVVSALSAWAESGSRSAGSA